MKISDKTYIVILIITIIILSMITYWRMQNFRQALPNLELPKIEIPSMELAEEDDLFSEYLFSQHMTEKQEWVSPDGKLKLTYSARWIATGEDFFKQSAQLEEMPEDILFLAYRFEIDWQKKPIIFIVKEFKQEKDQEEIIKKIKQETEEIGGREEITTSKAEDGNTWLEIFSFYPDKGIFYSKGKLIFGEEKTYLLLFISSYKDWSEFEEEVKKILDSAHLL